MDRSALCFACCLFSLATAPGTAQSGPQPPADLPGGFVESVDVNVVNVDVYVTDKRGHRVEGLERDDFLVKLDGDRIAVSNFYAVEAGDAGRHQRVAETLAGEAEAEAGGEGGAQRAGLELSPLAVPEEQQLHLVVYIDNRSLHPNSRERTMRFVREMIRDRFGTDDRIMVVAYERSVKVLQGFTSDRNLVLDALDEADDLSVLGSQMDNQRRDILNGIYDKKERWEVEGWARAYIETVYREVEESVTALQRLIETMAGLPGRKAVLYVSDGLAMRAGQDIFQAMEDVYNDFTIGTEVARYDATDRFARLTQMANAYRVTFYSVEAAGLQAYSFISAENATSRGGAQIDSVYSASQKDSLYMMAGETGGQAIVGTNNLTPMLDRVVDDFRSYYSLGIQPVGVLGRYHHLEVEVVGRKDLVVRHREGFRTRPPSAQMADITRSALHYGYQSNELGIRLEVGRGTRTERDIYEVPIVIRIPMGKLGFLPGPEKYSARLRFYVAVRDENGSISELQEMPVPIDISKENYQLAQSHDYQLQHRLLMRRGRQLVAVGIRDEIGSGRAVVTRGIKIGG